ncbi:hypothetical protein GQ457_14G024600 [Hibiscus cannabinus]
MIQAQSFYKLRMWDDKDVYVGITSSTIDESSPGSNSSSNVYLWRFRVWLVSSLMHSFLADSRGILDKDSDELRSGKEDFCALTVFSVDSKVSFERFRYKKVDVIVKKYNQFYKN